MKKIFKVTVICTLAALATLSCKKKEETYTRFDSPIWVVDSEVNFNGYVNMAAIVVLPDNIVGSAQEDDKLAAFAGEEVRGVATLIDGKYYITIVGTPEDNSPIHFEYYSARNRYMYKTAELFPFEADTWFGTVDTPEKLPLNVVR
ncbi:MAG: hypothetical protein LBN27_08995 [Prevotellaceae bacterium]|jgi:hypothetical protein|nr:hypothetical protein [Prevotellaceae bacterium]